MTTSSIPRSAATLVELVGRAEDRHAVDALAPLRVVVVEEPDRDQAELRVLLHLARDHGARLAGADDEARRIEPESPRSRPPRRHASPTTRTDRRMPATSANVSSQSISRTEREKPATTCSSVANDENTASAAVAAETESTIASRSLMLA